MLLPRGSEVDHRIQKFLRKSINIGFITKCFKQKNIPHAISLEKGSLKCFPNCPRNTVKGVKNDPLHCHALTQALYRKNR